VVLPGVQLLDDPRDSGLVAPHDHEYVSGIVPQAHEVQDDFDMGHALDASADFVLALDDQHAVRLEDTPGFDGRANVKLQDGVVPLAGEFRRPVAV